MGIGEDEDLVLDCYRLARWYRQNPEVFLAMPMSQVRLHMEHTLRLRRLMRRESSDED
jgi:hypothetical protein